MEAKSAGGIKYNKIGVLFSYLNYQTEKCVEINRSFLVIFSKSNHLPLHTYSRNVLGTIKIAGNH